MSLTRALPIALVGIFLIAATFMYQQNKSLMQDAKQQLENQYQLQSNNLGTWLGDGKALHKNLSANVPIQFFQYTDSTDGSRNFTFGVLHPQNTGLLETLFALESSDTRTLPEGRLLLKLDVSNIRAQFAGTFAHELAILTILLLASLAAFAWFSFTINRGIRLCADGLRKLPDFDSNLIDSSQLPAELAPMAAALTDSRHALMTYVGELRHENEKLTRIVNQDPLTGLGSRVNFSRRLEEIRKSSTVQIGCLAIVKATDLGNINQAQGRTAGDIYLNRIASTLRRAATPFKGAECFRINNVDFAVLLPNLPFRDSEQFLEPLKIALDEQLNTSGSESIAYSGLVPYNNGLDPINLLNVAEAAVSIAQTLGPNSYHMLEELTDELELDDDRWQTTIRNIIARRAVSFAQQPIQPVRNDAEVYKELFARFFNADDKVLPTATVIAMAEKSGLIVELDKLVLLSAIRILNENKQLSGHFGINISNTSATNEHFVAWLKDVMIKHSSVAARIVLEIKESGLHTNMRGSCKFIREVHGVGSRVSIERFGMGFTSFKFFREIRPDFIKLDASYSESIDKEENNRIFVRMMIDIARRIGIRVIACGVERQEEKMALEQLLLDGLQGYYIAEPQPISGLEDSISSRLA